MKAIRSIKNQYPGINAHLHSYWQKMGGWSEFHTNHIVDLANTLKKQLLPMGYTAALEPSLQIRQLDFAEKTEWPESDVTIYDLDPLRTSRPQPVFIAGHSAALQLSVAEAILEDVRSQKTYSALKIYDWSPDKQTPGQPIVWIELLSPTNKPGGSHAMEYLTKRGKIIDLGIVFVEIDYLHETAPTMRGIPVYRARKGQTLEDKSHPYRIVIVEPRPDVEAGHVFSYEFDVDAAIPNISIPLSAGEELNFNFGFPYQKTLEEGLYGFQLVDYTQIPENFDRYSETDQAKILSRMIAVIQAAQNDIDLETAAPLPIETLDLESAMKRLTALTQG